MDFFKSITPGEYIQILVAFLGFLGILFAAVNRWAVANQRDRLAMFTSAAGNAAGRIRETLNGLPPSADASLVKRQLLQGATAALLLEFKETAAKLGATPDKTTGIIEGQLADKPIAPGAPVPSVKPDLTSNIVRGSP